MNRFAPRWFIQYSSAECEMFVFWRSWQEMASAELREIRKALTKESIREHQLSKVGGTETDMFVCGKCKGKNCAYTQVSCQQLWLLYNTFTLQFTRNTNTFTLQLRSSTCSCDDLVLSWMKESLYCIDAWNEQDCNAGCLCRSRYAVLMNLWPPSCCATSVETGGK